MSIQQKHEAATTPTGGAVGSDAKAAHTVAKGDFGIAAKTPEVVKDHEGVIEGRPAGSAPGYSGSKGVRTTGVGSTTGEPGHASGGDVDPDYVGFGAGGAISAKPASTDELTGADVTDGSRDKFASGGPAAGRNTIKRGTHGAAPGFAGDTVDHSGDDANTNSSQAAGTVTPLHEDTPGAEGEVSMDEASGDVDQGAEV